MKKRQFILAATLLALFSSPLLYAFEDCGTSVTECKLRQTIQALQERNAQLEKENKALQEQTAKPEKENKALPQETTTGFFRDRLKDGSLGPKMVWIPAGTFWMGDIQGGGVSAEKPVHEVSVSRFAMGVYEVTFAEYDKSHW
ncbi:MAG: SUMF1/EgtB/PvdO family nonheme iron enzyme [Pseudomonadota bacterium]